MSQEEPKPEQSQPELAGNEGAGEQAEEMSAEQQQAYNKMMSTLSKMNTKIERVKAKLPGQILVQKKTKTDEMTNKLIESKQNSEIITKQNLLSDITETYEQVVIGIYSENSKLKKKIDQMAKIIHQQNAKIYQHSQREKDLIKLSEDLRAEVAKLKDEKMMLARGQVHAQTDRPQDANSTSKKKGLNTNQTQGQNEDFDFWSMPQNDYAKKKKDFVQDSNLWVNQRETSEGVFLTEEQRVTNKKKK